MLLFNYNSLFLLLFNYNSCVYFASVMCLIIMFSKYFFLNSNLVLIITTFLIFLIFRVVIFMISQETFLTQCFFLGSVFCVYAYIMCVCAFLEIVYRNSGMLRTCYHWSYDHNLSNSFFFKKISNLALLCKSYCFNSLFKYNFSCDSSRKN